MNPSLLAKSDPAVIHRVFALIDDHMNAPDVGQHDRLTICVMSILREIGRRPPGITEYAHSLEVLTAVTLALHEAARAALIKLR